MKKIPKVVKEIRKHKVKDIDWKNQKLISYSQMSMYDGCPKRWSLTYKEGHKVFSSTIHTVFGSALHKAIQHYLTVMYNESGASADREDIVGLFEESLRNEYKEQYKKNNNQHFSSPDELREFFEDGINILEFFQKKKSSYFSKRGWYLVGCEIPILVAPHETLYNVIYQGFLDVVLYHEPTNEFLILDLKTSTNSWNDEKKKDKIKQYQLVLYKHFFSKQFNVPEDSIKVEFFILKRKIWENSEYPQSRIQNFIPPSGKVSVNKALDTLNNFIESCFDVNGYKENNHTPTPSKLCSYCPFDSKSDLCLKNR